MTICSQHMKVGKSGRSICGPMIGDGSTDPDLYGLPFFVNTFTLSSTIHRLPLCMRPSTSLTAWYDVLELSRWVARQSHAGVRNALSFFRSTSANARRQDDVCQSTCHSGPVAPHRLVEYCFRGQEQHETGALWAHSWLWFCCELDSVTWIVREIYVANENVKIRWWKSSREMWM